MNKNFIFDLQLFENEQQDTGYTKNNGVATVTTWAGLIAAAEDSDVKSLTVSSPIHTDFSSLSNNSLTLDLNKMQQVMVSNPIPSFVWAIDVNIIEEII